MINIQFNNSLLHFIFIGLLSSHSQSNIQSSLLGFPLAGVVYAKNKLFRKRGVYNRQIIVYYKLDSYVNPKIATIIGFRFGKMNAIISRNTHQNRQLISEIFKTYPDKSIRDKIY
ncbi:MULTISPECIES: hypothetical protein [Glaesserella]|uniref:Uncharacterized protein n=1 Tax=Glaesserella australis TaxID=2094024 RepID=A0A328C566_9PAST|nr:MULTISPECIES: hypothetical protein [Glaesserella]AUI65468.1 hypothetical protein CJD39_02240 [Glaesserella sp. 15-184]RAL19664.1 hypothetical protein C5N92_01325 [Glaesserella australis]